MKQIGFVALLILLGSVMPVWAQSGGGSTEDDRGVARVSLNYSGEEGNLDSFAPAISADGRYVAFASTSDNLVATDTNNVQDIFRHDLRTGQVMRISSIMAGQEANGESRHPALSGDGTVIVFESLADNLTPMASNGVWNVFVYDVATREMVALSAGGNGDSVHPAVSADGRYITFISLADNLVPEDTNGKSDVFVYDRVVGTTERVSVGEAGIQSNDTTMYPTISADGQYIAYQSRADNLAGMGNGYYFDIFLYDRNSGETSLISQNGEGVIGNHESQRPAISANGRYVAFESWADNLVANDTNATSDVFVYDRAMGITSRVSVGRNGEQSVHVSGEAAISANGRYVAFASLADNLVENDGNSAYDVFLHDRNTGETTLVSLNEAYGVGNGSSMGVSIGGGGRYVVFDSLATDLVADDTNYRTDVFLYDKFMSVIFSNTVYLPIVTQ